MKDTFDVVPISVPNYLKSEPEPLKRSFEIVRSIDEKGRLFDLLFLAESTKEQHGELRGSRLKQSDVEELVSFGIDGSVQLVSFAIDPNHCLVDRDLIRGSVASGL